MCACWKSYQHRHVNSENTTLLLVVQTLSCFSLKQPLKIIFSHRFFPPISISQYLFLKKTKLWIGSEKLNMLSVYVGTKSRYANSYAYYIVDNNSLTSFDMSDWNTVGGKRGISNRSLFLKESTFFNIFVPSVFWYLKLIDRLFSETAVHNIKGILVWAWW